MSLSQNTQLQRIRRFMESRLDKNPEYRDTLEEFSVDYTGKLAVVSASTCMEGLPPGNLLRYVAREFWMFAVTSRGKVTVVVAPDSFRQFNGKKIAEGFHVRLG